MNYNPILIVSGEPNSVFLELFFKADAVVLLVMLSLIFLSVWCWAIIFNKYFKFKLI